MQPPLCSQAGYSPSASDEQCNLLGPYVWSIIQECLPYQLLPWLLRVCFDGCQFPLHHHPFVPGRALFNPSSPSKLAGEHRLNGTGLISRAPSKLSNQGEPPYPTLMLPCPLGMVRSASVIRSLFIIGEGRGPQTVKLYTADHGWPFCAPHCH